MMSKNKNCLILAYTELPQHIQDIIRKFNGFNRDCLLRISKYSELSVKDYIKGMVSIEEYYIDQKQTNNFTGTLENFIDEYRLEIDKWIIEKKFNLTNIDEILVEIS